MKLQLRLALLMGLLTLLPALPAAWLARGLITRSLDLGFSTEVDAALDAGVRQARDNLALRRQALADSLAVWASALAGADADVDELGEAWLALPDAAPHPGTELRLVSTTGRITLLTAAGASESAAPTSMLEPPHRVTAAFALRGGGRVEASTPVTEEWLADARVLATSLQTVRGLRAQREDLDSVFWLPFVIIYALALLVALTAAILLSRGLTRPLGRLVEATREVAAGSWDVQVVPAGSGEVRQLGERFNAMVRTLDAQSRHLIDLEKMAGWREMARALAHEVKNPLTPIQLTVEEIRERYRGDDPVYRSLLDECTRIIVQEVESLRSVVTRFREFSRPVEPRFATVDVNALVADVAALQRDLTVDLDLAPETGTIQADADRLRQVLMNLARNARQATAGRPGARLLLVTRPAANRITLVVEDNGPGVPPAERESIFEPYRSGTKGGLGLGLTLVKGIVLAHGGSIRVEDGHWGGARFVIELPRRPEPGGPS